MSDNVRNIAAIAGKELRSYFASPVAWVIMALFAVIFGRFFVVMLDFYLLESMRSQFGGGAGNVNERVIRPLLSNASVLILFLLPMLTMRAYAEEKRSGTIELLLTSPLKDLEIVLGKFLGAMGLFAGLLAVAAAYVALLFFSSKLSSQSLSGVAWLKSVSTRAGPTRFSSSSTMICSFDCRSFFNRSSS